MKESKLSQGKIALVSNKDYVRVNKFKWCAYFDGWNWYAVRTAYKTGTKTTVYMHRVILGLKTGDPGPDHHDGNGLNNMRRNLRKATLSQNMMNQGTRSDNTSGVVGVFWNKADGIWMAQINVNGNRIHLGCFTNKADAVAARRAGELKYHGAFSALLSRGMAA